jgi:hypothetical protein
MSQAFNLLYHFSSFIGGILYNGLFYVSLVKFVDKNLTYSCGGGDHGL